MQVSLAFGDDGEAQVPEKTNPRILYFYATTVAMVDSFAFLRISHLSMVCSSFSFALSLGIQTAFIAPCLRSSFVL